MCFFTHVCFWIHSQYKVQFCVVFLTCILSNKCHAEKSNTAMVLAHTQTSKQGCLWKTKNKQPLNYSLTNNCPHNNIKHGSILATSYQATVPIMTHPGIILSKYKKTKQKKQSTSRRSWVVPAARSPYWSWKKIQNWFIKSSMYRHTEQEFWNYFFLFKITCNSNKNDFYKEKARGSLGNIKTAIFSSIFCKCYSGKECKTDPRYYRCKRLLTLWPVLFKKKKNSYISI